jgi:hypothetical protein
MVHSHTVATALPHWHSLRSWLIWIFENRRGGFIVRCIRAASNGFLSFHKLGAGVVPNDHSRVSNFLFSRNQSQTKKSTLRNAASQRGFWHDQQSAIWNSYALWNSHPAWLRSATSAAFGTIKRCNFLLAATARS